MSVAPHPVGAVRRQARRVAGMAAIALAPLLALQLGVLWLVRTDAETELPEFLAARIRPHLEQAGIFCRWESARINLSGRIALTDATVGAAGSADPVFEAGRLVVMIAPLDLLFAHRITPVRLWLDRGRLLCPASVSPTGRREVALDRIRADLRREGDRLVVNTLQADCAGVPLVAHGRILPPRPRAPNRAAPSATPPNPLREPVRAASRLVALRPWLSLLENASLELRGDDTPDGARLTLDGLADALEIPAEGLRAEKLRLRADLLWDAAGPRPESETVFGFQSLRVNRPASGAIRAIDARCAAVEIRAAFGRNWELPNSVRVTAHHPEANGFPLDLVSAELIRQGERLRLRGDLNWKRETIAVDAVANPATGELRAAFDARVRPDVLLTHPRAPRRADFPAELDGLAVPGIVVATGGVTLSPGWKFHAADVRAEIGRLSLAPVTVDAARIAARITPDSLSIPAIELEAPGRTVVASVETGYTAASPYRILVKGRAYPGEVRPFVGRWWDRIWADLALTPGHPGFVDLDVSGQWDGLPYENIFARVAAEKLSYRRQVFDRVSVRLLEEPAPVHRISLHDLRMSNEDGSRANGELEWRYAPHASGEHRRESCRFRFKGRLTKDVGAQIAGDDVVAALADVKLRDPAEGEVIGRYDGVMSATPGRDRLEVRIRSTGPFEAWKLPGSDFSGVVLLDGRRVEIRDAALRYAGGATTGRAWLLLDPSAYRLTFDATFKDCDRTAFFAGIAALKGPPAKPEPAAKKPATPEKPQPPALVSGNLKARVILPDMATFDGSGAGVIHDPGMPSLPLLGALSRGLESMGIEAATYRFDTVESPFFIRNNAVWFPALKIRGPEAVVEAAGKYAVGPGDITFRATLVPNKSDKLPVYDWAKNILTGATKLFPVEVTGTLDNPKWKVDPTPSAILTSKRDDSLGLPPPPAPDDGKW